MISINTRSISTAKLTDRSIVASCLLGLSNVDTGMSGIPAVRPASSVSLSGLEIRERNERPTQAPEAVAAVARASAYAFAAAGGGSRKQTQHHVMWAFRGLEPWSDPA